MLHIDAFKSIYLYRLTCGISRQRENFGNFYTIKHVLSLINSIISHLKPFFRNNQVAIRNPLFIGFGLICILWYILKILISKNIAEYSRWNPIYLEIFAPPLIKLKFHSVYVIYLNITRHSAFYVKRATFWCA